MPLGRGPFHHKSFLVVTFKKSTFIINIKKHIKNQKKGCSPVAQRVKDPLSSLLWPRRSHMLWRQPKKKEKQKKKRKESEGQAA